MEILTKRTRRSLAMIMAEIAKKEQKLFKVNKSGYAADGNLFDEHGPIRIR